MKRPLRIGLLAEGETELGASVPYFKDPQQGGKPIDPEIEGALHKLIRRELLTKGIAECEFIHRHPSLGEIRKQQLRVGYSVANSKYLAQLSSAWNHNEVDLIIIVIDSDKDLAKRKLKIRSALKTIQEYQFGADDEPISDQSVGGLAIKNFETWLLSDTSVVEELLDVTLDPLPTNLEDLSADAQDPKFSKTILDNAIANSSYKDDMSSNQRELEVRWDLAKSIDLLKIKSRCPQGYAMFASDLHKVAKTTVSRI